MASRAETVRRRLRPTDGTGEASGPECLARRIGPLPIGSRFAFARRLLPQQAVLPAAAACTAIHQRRLYAGGAPDRYAAWPPSRDPCPFLVFRSRRPCPGGGAMTRHRRPANRGQPDDPHAVDRFIGLFPEPSISSSWPKAGLPGHRIGGGGGRECRSGWAQRVSAASPMRSSSGRRSGMPCGEPRPPGHAGIKFFVISWPVQRETAANLAETLGKSVRHPASAPPDAAQDQGHVVGGAGQREILGRCLS